MTQKKEIVFKWKRELKQSASMHLTEVFSREYQSNIKQAVQLREVSKMSYRRKPNDVRAVKREVTDLKRV